MPPPSLVISARTSPLALAERAYRLSMMGLYTRGLAQFERAGSQADALVEADRGRLILLWGLAARAEGDLEGAANRLRDATEQLVAGAARAEAAVALGLWVEATCAVGKLEDARVALEQWASRTPAEGRGVLDLGTVFLQLARGDLQEALTLADRLRASAQDPLQTWLRLCAAEARLELGRPLEAEQDLDALYGELRSRRRFEEGVVRTLALRARVAVDALAAMTRAAQPDELAAAGVWVARLFRYSINFPRCRAEAVFLAGALDLVAGRGEGRLGEALGILEQVGSKLDQGRMIAREAVFRFGYLQAPTRALVARGRDLLTRAGASARSNHMAQVEGAGAETNVSVMLSRSILGAANPEDDVELNAIFEVTRAISSTLDADAVLQRILDEVVRLLKAERGALLRVLPDGSIRCIAGRRIDPDRVTEGGDELSFGIVREVQRSGEVVLTDNAQLDDRFRGRASVLATEIRSLLCAPLKTQKGVLGFLYLDSTVKSRIFKPSHRELLGVFATQAAISLENALQFQEIEGLNRGLEDKVRERTSQLASANEELQRSLDTLRTTQLRLVEAERAALEKEMQLARRIQEAIIPAATLLERPGLRVQGVVESATHVGGDFWSISPLGEDRTLLLVGDVTGHGVASGMVTTIARACCDTLLRRSPKFGLQELFCTLSDVLFDSAGGQMAMTAFACIVDPGRRLLTFASAGHNPPMLVEAGSGLPSLAALVATGPRLGDAQGNLYEVKERPYGAGDRLILYTDGIVECTNGSAEYGGRRFRRQVLGHARRPLQEHFGNVLADARLFFGDHPREDDVTLVMAELA
jgi:phosphoserine phosphatase RsbU/P